jgi:hypothetical protein
MQREKASIREKSVLVFELPFASKPSTVPAHFISTDGTGNAKTQGNVRTGAYSPPSQQNIQNGSKLACKQ